MEQEHHRWVCKRGKARNIRSKMDERKLSRRLSRLRVAHDIAQLNDFLLPHFAPADVVEKLARTCGLGSQAQAQGHPSQKQVDSLGGIDLLLSACIE